MTGKLDLDPALVAKAAADVEPVAVQARAVVGKRENIEKQILVPVVALHRHPLHLVFIGVGFKAQ